MRALLDTHVLLWWLAGSDRLLPEHAGVITAAGRDAPLYVSDISLWEVATLVERGRIELDRPLREWLERAVAPPLVRRLGLSPAVCAGVAALPDDFQRDPADRILVATAQVHGATLLTVDARIRRAGLVPTLPA